MRETLLGWLFQAKPLRCLQPLSFLGRDHNNTQKDIRANFKTSGSCPRCVCCTPPPLSWLRTGRNPFAATVPVTSSPLRAASSSPSPTRSPDPQAPLVRERGMSCCSHQSHPYTTTERPCFAQKQLHRKVSACLKCCPAKGASYQCMGAEEDEAGLRCHISPAGTHPVQPTQERLEKLKKG